MKLIGNEFMEKVKKWLIENGFMGFAALVVAGIAILLGMWFVFWGSIGFFLGKNWQIILNLWENKYKDIVTNKVEDLVDEVKDKIKK